jgi:SAM-dependent MidA family methyltransferase
MPIDHTAETWEHWMARALYEPGKGYYSSHIQQVGTRGDFSTSVTLGKELATALAAWIRRRSSELGWRGRIPVIEVGPGTGELLLAIHRALPFWVRLRLEYHLVEVSSPLKENQKRLLRGCRVFWHDDMNSALRQTGGRALIYSNELVDAFPCRSFVRRSGRWKEMGVRVRTPVVEVELDAADVDEGRLETSAFNLWSTVREGQRIEVHAGYHKWLRNWAADWLEGFQLTIDYGYVAEPRPRLALSGTIRAYYQHMRLEGDEIYRRMGRQDLTADVNFTDLENWGRRLGWKTESLQSQADWLRGMDHLNAPASRLADPHDAGGGFMVLEQCPQAPVSMR